MKNIIEKIILKVAFVQALIATLGSLYFSEIANFVPCTLCWYQRICMYPLVVILGIGIAEKKKDIYKYVLPFSIIGWLIAVYHNLLQYGIISESVYMCTAIGSCTQRYVNLYGIITIPLMSLVAFSVINICIAVYIVSRDKKTR